MLITASSRRGVVAAPGGPGAAHHVVEVATGRPAEVGARHRRVGDDLGRIAGAALDQIDWQRDPEDPAHRLDDLEHRGSDAGPDVVRRLQTVAGLEALGRGDVGIGEIADVDVVADARPVRRGVVGAVHLRCLAGVDGAEHEREQVVRAAVVDVVVARTDHVEVAQGRVAQRCDAGDIGEEPLTDQLRLAVWALGSPRRRLDDGDGGGRAVHRTARRVHELFDAGGDRLLEQHAHPLDVHPVEAQRLGDRDARVLEGGEVNDAVDPGVARARERTSGASPIEPSTNVASVGTKERTPLDRSSRTTTSRPASTSRRATWEPM